MNAVVYKDGKLQIETVQDKMQERTTDNAIDTNRYNADYIVDTGSTGGVLHGEDLSTNRSFDKVENR